MGGKLFARTGVFSVALVVAVVAGRSLVLPESSLAWFWPASGVGALWALLASSRGELWLVAGVVSVVSGVTFQVAGFSPLGVVLMVVANLIMTVGVRAGVGLFTRARQGRGGLPPTAGLRSPWEVSRLALVALVMITISALPVMLAIAANGGDPRWEDAVSHVFRNVGGLLLIVGTTLAWLDRDENQEDPSAVQVVGAFGATLVLALVVFGSSQQMQIAHALLLPLFWSGIRFAPWLASLHAVFTTAVTVTLVLTVGGNAFGLGLTPLALSIRTQLFILLCAILSLVVSTALSSSGALARGLRLARDQSRRLIADAPHGIAVTSSTGAVKGANRALNDLLHSPDLEGTQLSTFTIDDGQQLGSLLRHSAQSGQPVTTDLTLRRPDGGVVEASVTAVAMPSGSADTDEALVYVVDVSERRRYERHLAHLAERDALTGLLNRHGLQLVLAERERVLAEEGEDTALLVIDLDHFKMVNDTWGHAAGDELLTSIADMLRTHVRATDAVDRLGGDEFAVVLPGAALAAGRRVGELVLERIRAIAASHQGEVRRITGSVGVVTLATARQIGGDPMVLADLLMYDAKEEGRDTLAVLDPEQGDGPRMSVRLATQKRIEDALAAGSFTLHLQPILDVGRNVVLGAEALVRLQDGADIVQPGDFLPVAESSGLVLDIDIWVVREALRLLAELDEIAPGFTLSANVSAGAVVSPRYEEALMAALAEHPPGPQRFILELTETSVVSDMGVVADFGRRLAARGVGLAIDDFGTGHASFGYLKELDVGYIKIDGSFVQDIVHSPVDRAIVSSVVQMAQDLGKQTVAEFVGDAATLEAIRTLGVRFAQGFEVGRPVPADDFVDIFLSD